jgi:hypothetical protein
MPPRHGGLFLVLGGAPSVWAELEAATALLGDRGFGVAACNNAAVVYDGQLDAFATLHPEHLTRWRRERKGNADFWAFVPTAHAGCVAEVLAERWAGSSGLYAAQAALDGMAASGVILCGVPMDPAAGHFTYGGRWTGGEGYRKGFVAALPHIGGRVRSMSGWTRDLFGPPTPTWLDAISGAKPARSFRPVPMRTPMFKVTNVSQTLQRFNAFDPAGGFQLVRLGPDESGLFDIDPNQAKFQPGGAFVVVETATETPAQPKPGKAGEAVAVKAASVSEVAAEPAPEPEKAPPET